MFSLKLDASHLVGRAAEFQRAFPIATVLALNTSAFEVRSGWGQKMRAEFDRPTPLTLSATLYKKATVQHPVAEVYLRNTAARGTPPVKYLLAQVRGGGRRQKGSERALEAKGFAPYWVPGHGASHAMDAHGNVKASVVRAVMSSIRGSSNSAERGKKKSKRSSLRGYFLSPASKGKGGSIIFERMGDGSIRSILYGVERPPRYRVRLNVFTLSAAIFRARFRINLDAAMKKARW